MPWPVPSVVEKWGCVGNCSGHCVVVCITQLSLFNERWQYWLLWKDGHSNVEFNLSRISSCIARLLWYLVYYKRAAADFQARRSDVPWISRANCSSQEIFSDHCYNLSELQITCLKLWQVFILQSYRTGSVMLGITDSRRHAASVWNARNSTVGDGCGVRICLFDISSQVSSGQYIVQEPVGNCSVQQPYMGFSGCRSFPSFYCCRISIFYLLLCAKLACLQMGC